MLPVSFQVQEELQAGESRGLTVTASLVTVISPCGQAGCKKMDRQYSTQNISVVYHGLSHPISCQTCQTLGCLIYRPGINRGINCCVLLCNCIPTYGILWLRPLEAVLLRCTRNAEERPVAAGNVSSWKMQFTSDVKNMTKSVFFFVFRSLRDYPTKPLFFFCFPCLMTLVTIW